MMGQMFGSRWTSAFGDEDTGDVWRAGLKCLSDSDIKRGLNRMVSDNYKWPPSLPEFRELCQEQKKQQSSFGGAHKALPIGLPEPKEFVSRRKKKGREQIGCLLSMMGSKSKFG